MTEKSMTIDLRQIHGGLAKLADCARYLEQITEMAGHGNVVILTGQAPVWLYLKAAHALHGNAKRLLYRSPVTGDVVIFDHDPF